MTVIPDVERVLKEFHEAKKPIGYVPLYERPFLMQQSIRFYFVYVLYKHTWQVVLHFTCLGS